LGNPVCDLIKCSNLIYAIKQRKGAKGEEIATDYLIEKGYTILERNWRHHHLEVDIIASKESLLHIIEVKTRHSLRYGRPEESITRDKMTFFKKRCRSISITAYLFGSICNLM
jgi:Holliday junction resolvase-like predicted endonuclease